MKHWTSPWQEAQEPTAVISGEQSSWAGAGVQIITITTTQAAAWCAMETFDLNFIPTGVKHIMHINNANACVWSFQIKILPKLSKHAAWKDLLYAKIDQVLGMNQDIKEHSSSTFISVR